MNPDPVDDRYRISSSPSLTDTARHLRDHLTRRQVIEYDVQEVMIRGARIDDFMRRRRSRSRCENSWTTVRRELDELAKAFNSNGAGTQPNDAARPGPATTRRLSGTYRLDPAQKRRRRHGSPYAGDTQSVGGGRERVEENLAAPPRAADVHFVDRNGNAVSIASEKARVARSRLMACREQKRIPAARLDGAGLVLR